MVKVKGVNIFPSQIDELLSKTEGASSEYRFILDHVEGRDVCTLSFECSQGCDKQAWARS
jgi:phenylacetate-CoA ligase